MDIGYSSKILERKKKKFWVEFILCTIVAVSCHVPFRHIFKSTISCDLISYCTNPNSCHIYICKACNCYKPFAHKFSGYNEKKVTQYWWVMGMSLFKAFHLQAINGYIIH